MGENFELFTNKELIDYYNQLNSDYEKEQLILKNAYDNMIALSEKAIQIKNIITKRGGSL